jgi:hypothetical protein
MEGASNWGGLPNALDQLLDLQWFATGRVAHQRKGFLRTLGDAHTAAHTSLVVDPGLALIHCNGTELPRVGASAVGRAQLFFHLGYLAG